MPLELLSERYAATGGVAAAGVLNNLGQPPMEPYELLTREALQNCWDAKRPDAETVHVRIAHYDLDALQLRALRDEVLGGQFPRDLPAERALAGSRVGVLYFADFGTRGLGGPARADHVVDERDSDFADLVFNIGQPPDTAHGGGSYGFGKGAFYRRSDARVVVFHTLCTNDGRLEERFIAVGLGDVRPGASAGARLTGRHWWGRVDGEVVLPAVGDDAAALAKAIGLPVRASSDDLGTTVAVIAPDLEDGDVDVAGHLEFVAECVAWNFWPKLIPDGEEAPAMTVSVLRGETPIPVPNPRAHPQLAGFVAALDVLRRGHAGDDPFAEIFPIALQRPATDVGRLVLRYSSDSVNPTEETTELTTQGARAMADGVHHVALMRQAELVVQYRAGAMPSVPGLGYTGVFKCERGVDEVFRAAEPPTHDEWIIDSAPDAASKRILRRAAGHIKDRCKDFVAARAPAVPLGHEGVPLGAASASLMALMPALIGTGAARPAVVHQGPGLPGVSADPTAAGDADEAAKPARPRRPPRPRGSIGLRLGSPILREDDAGRVVRSVPVEVDADVPAVLQAEVRVHAGDGKVEKEPPDGWSPPQLEWHLPGGTIERGATCPVDASDETTHIVAVVVSEDELMVVLDVRADPAGQ